MTLLEQQQLFCRLIGAFIGWIYSQGYAISFGEAWRTPEQAQWNAENGSGIAHSLHTERLAIDLNLFLGGQIVATVDGYRPLGTYWKTLHELARWGGDFQKPDADHFSLTRGGVS